MREATASVGPYPDGPETVPCEACGGKGFAPNELGRRVLELVRRHALEAAMQLVAEPPG